MTRMLFQSKAGNLAAILTPNNRQGITIMHSNHLNTNPIEQFCDAMRSTGLKPPLSIEPGKFYRFPGAGKTQSNRAGWCRLFPDLLGGAFGDFSSGLSSNWRINTNRHFTATERVLFNKHLAETKAQIELERKTSQDNAKIRANEIWIVSDFVSGEHPYLVHKNITANGVKIYRGYLKISGMQCHGAIIVPLFYQGELVSLQFINRMGEKRFLPGGKITGCYYLLGANQIPTHGRLLVCEGLATGAIINKLTHCPVAIAFNARNLIAVAQEISRLSLPIELVIACDNDRNTTGNPGMRLGREAAVNAGASIVWPDFPCSNCECSDFNDLSNCLRSKKEALA
ncbi:MAG: hypothetical protein EBY22_08245 [Gammaproteobacteria bacterium]|nr:hypothetical protein [Gammaproteobacteria bacterium]